MCIFCCKIARWLRVFRFRLLCGIRAAISHAQAKSPFLQSKWKGDEIITRTQWKYNFFAQFTPSSMLVLLNRSLTRDTQRTVVTKMHSMGSSDGQYFDFSVKRCDLRLFYFTVFDWLRAYITRSESEFCGIRMNIMNMAMRPRCLTRQQLFHWNKHWYLSCGAVQAIFILLHMIIFIFLDKHFSVVRMHFIRRQLCMHEWTINLDFGSLFFSAAFVYGFCSRRRDANGWRRCQPNGIQYCAAYISKCHLFHRLVLEIGHIECCSCRYYFALKCE